MKAVALALAALGLAGLAFIAFLLVDGLRAVYQRRREERRQRPLRLVVRSREEVGGELLRLTLAHPRRRPLPVFEAGQHLMMTAPAGRGGGAIRRAYSLAAWHPRPTWYELGIKREAQGAMSSWAWNALLPGAVVDVSPPRGDFVVADDELDLVLIAGGIGITPMRAMLHASLARPRARRIVLLHAARHAGTLLYRGEFESLASLNPHFSYLPIVSRPDGFWRGERGRLDAHRVLAAVPTPQQARFYLCAGQALMEDLGGGLIAAGIDPARIHSEAFGAASAGGGHGQVITLEDGRRVDTAGEPSLLATLEAHGCAPPSDCRAGSCGECRMRLDAGAVRWLMAPACAVADGEILPCICQPAGDLRLRAA
ncbi:FAD-binding oxidoreductase [Azoarcus olearius]|nr:FAD-binding oxidoreductase [Azoarcus olearius]